MSRKRLLLVRHGEYERLPVSGVYAGLTSRGRRQVAKLARYRSSEPIQRTVCSPLSRARETEDILSAGEVLLLVAYGNLIRALICRALGTRLSLWHKMRIHHCSITELEIGPEGEVCLIRFNDTGFMPHSMRTV